MSQHFLDPGRHDIGGPSIDPLVEQARGIPRFEIEFDTAFDPLFVSIGDQAGGGIDIARGPDRNEDFGPIEGGSLEQSNVDLTQELADMIVIQRGYQASSHAMTISSDMLQQLYDSTRSE